QVQAALATFLARHDLRTRLAVREEAELLAGAFATLWRTHKPAAAYEEYNTERRQRIAAQAVLTEFRLYWDALSRALAGRDKVIIDAEKLPGRRHLLLLDPDQFRIPVPMITTPERGARSAPNQGSGANP